MATNKDPFFANKPVTQGTSFTDADTTVAKTVFAANTDGTALVLLNATSTDTAALTLALFYNDGSTDYQVGEVIVPAGAGTDGTTPSKSLLDAVKLPGLIQNDGSITFQETWLLKIKVGMTMTASKKLDIIAQGGLYGA